MSPMAASNTFITGFRPEWSEFRHFSGLIGTNDSVVANYRFAPQVGTQQWVCAKGLGYYKGYNGSEFGGVWSNWYDLGCKKAGGGFSGRSLQFRGATSPPSRLLDSSPSITT